MLKEIKNEGIIREKDFAEYFSNMWKESIVLRGKEYYESGNVLKVIKCNNNYYGIVQGNDINPYFVTINAIRENNVIIAECSCPCEFNCKHSYATLLAISERKYEKINNKSIVLIEE